MNTQHNKIIELFSDGKFHCKNEVRAIFVHNFHKRKIEIEGRKNRNELPQGKYIFEERPCEHGVKGQKDYQMHLNTRLYHEVSYYIPEMNKTITRLEKNPSLI